MGIILNGHLTRTIKGKLLGGAMVGLRQSSQDVWHRNKLQTFAKFVSIPSGTRPPHSFMMPQEIRGLTMRSSGDSGLPDGNLAGGINCSTSIAGLSSVDNANISLLIYASAAILANSSFISDISGAVGGSANINGSGSISNALPFVIADISASILSGSIISGADFSSAINIYASISASSSWDDANGSMVGALASAIICSAFINANGNNALNFQAAIDAVGSMSQADIRATADMALSVLGIGSVSDALPRANASASANITPFTELSPQTLSKAVWDQLSADNNTPNTMGYVLNNVSTGGVNVNDIAEAVWAQLKINSNDPDTMGELMNQVYVEVQKRLKKTDFLALK